MTEKEFEKARDRDESERDRKNRKERRHSGAREEGVD